ncbi:hypothetical protein CDL15_Pgr005237 [Punica granatum]|uniref:Beta-catenin-like protein 1 N-terminal domain-containing protein n=1 Tax=Punica granatum TaxID=22663 RepID=A0A218WP71_PUNGR|nr:hypothetical protein CDL15_Pgr005237 [Punica granatum]
MLRGLMVAALSGLIHQQLAEVTQPPLPRQPYVAIDLHQLLDPHDYGSKEGEGRSCPLPAASLAAVCLLTTFRTSSMPLPLYNKEVFQTAMHGRWFKTRIFGKVHVFAPSTEAAKAIFTNEFVHFNKGYVKSMADAVGKKSLLCVAHDSHRRIRRLLSEPFSMNSLSKFVTKFDQMLSKRMRKFEEDGKSFVVLDFAMKRNRGDDGDIDIFLLEAIERSHNIVEMFGLKTLKKLVSPSKRRLEENIEARLKYPDQLDRFANSEVGLHEEIQKLKVLSGSPEFYPDLVALNAVPSILGLLSHD